MGRFYQAGVESGKEGTGTWQRETTQPNGRCA